MKKILTIVGSIALTITPTSSFADHLQPVYSQIRSGGFLSHMDFSGDDLSDLDLSGARLNQSNLSGTTLTNTNFQGAILNRADFSNARMNNTVFNGANLSGAILSGTNPLLFEAKDLRGCPTSLPIGWACENRQIIPRQIP